MVDVKNRKCNGGCGRQPHYNYKGKTKGLYCAQCKLDGMVNVLNRKCNGGCGRQPSFNFEGKTKGLYCSQCKLDGMVDVTHRKCKGGCGRQPNYNYKGKTQSLYCAQCKLDGMVDVTSRKCNGGCGRLPNYNYKGKTKGLYCTQCKLDGMVYMQRSKRISKNNAANLKTNTPPPPSSSTTLKKPTKQETEPSIIKPAVQIIKSEPLEDLSFKCGSNNINRIRNDNYCDEYLSDSQSTGARSRNILRNLVQNIRTHKRKSNARIITKK
eukprot:Pgem_evm1s9436